MSSRDAVTAQGERNAVGTHMPVPASPVHAKPEPHACHLPPLSTVVVIGVEHVHVQDR